MKHLILLLIGIAPFCTFSQTPSNIEAAEHDPVNNRYFVSNSSNILVTENGGQTWSVFGAGSATHGMEVLGNTLFVISSNNIRGYDLTSAAEVMTLSIPGVVFLNGMGQDGDHTLFVTDFGAKKIYSVDVSDLANPQYTLIVSNTVTTPNGIAYDGFNNRLVFVNWGMNAPIKAVDLSDNSVTTVMSGSYVNCDGIDIDDEGNFYMSTWGGQNIFQFSNDFSSGAQVVNSGLSNPADISYASATDTLVVANSGSNQVTFHYLGGNNVVETDKGHFGVYPNPVEDHAILTFELIEAGEVEIDIYSMDGKCLRSWGKTSYPAGKQQVELQSLNLATGSYFFTLTDNKKRFFRLILVK